jgi:hypothetical protein
VRMLHLRDAFDRNDVQTGDGLHRGFVALRRRSRLAFIWRNRRKRIMLGFDRSGDIDADYHRDDLRS